MLQEIINEAAEALMADPFFVDVPIVAEDLGDPSNKVDESIAKGGICVILMTPKASVISPDISGPYFGSIDFIAAVFENVVMNRGRGGTKKAALTVAEHICAVLHFHKPENISEPIIASNPTITLIPDPSLLAYNVNFRTNGGITYAIPQIEKPVYSQAGAAVTLSCATPNAHIFYTTDDTNPTPRTATLYTGSFNVAAHTVIRAKAWLAGYRPSATLRQVTP